MRLIDADAVWERYNKEYRQQDIYDGAQDKDWLERCINEAETIDANTRHGVWEFRFDGAYGKRRAYCSVCGKRSGIGGIIENQKKPYCPNCGAKWGECENERNNLLW